MRTPCLSWLCDLHIVAVQGHCSCAVVVGGDCHWWAVLACWALHWASVTDPVNQGYLCVHLFPIFVMAFPRKAMQRERIAWVSEVAIWGWLQCFGVMERQNIMLEGLGGAELLTSKLGLWGHSQMVAGRYKLRKGLRKRYSLQEHPCWWRNQAASSSRPSSYELINGIIHLWN